MIKIALIPIDNRPICYDLAFDILSMDKDIKLFAPDLSILGGLTTKTDSEKLLSFIDSLSNIDYFIASLDTLAWGGLVASRRCEDSYNTAKDRIDKFLTTISKKAEKILAFSSIMRISNNNINEEEKPYWDKWGKRIFDWSYYLDKSNREQIENCVINKIPDYILDDYLNTRKRNFEINKYYLSLAKQGFFDTLVFSKDDCAQFGLNVAEARELDAIIKKEKIKNAKIKTGADEIPLSLLARALGGEIKINPIFTIPESKDLVSKYEDISIFDCAKGQIELAACTIDNENPDLNLIVNNFEKTQGDLVLGDIINKNNKKINYKKPYCIADVNNANGADQGLIENLLKNDIKDFFGYCAYNTSANTIGCALLAAKTRFLAIKKGTYNEDAFKKLQFIRLLDDWVYQAVYRKQVRDNNPNFLETLQKIEPQLNDKAKIISDFLNYYPKKISYSLPWDRSFEIRIKLS